MIKYSDKQYDGVPLFGANLKQDPLFFPSLCKYSVKKLSEIILQSSSKFDNKTIDEVYREHNYNTNYVKQNYKDAIEILIKNKNIRIFNKKNMQTKRITYTAKIKFS